MQALHIDRGDRRNSKVEVVGKERERSVVVLVAILDNPEQKRAFLIGVETVEPNERVEDYVSVLGYRPVCNNGIIGVFFQTSDEKRPFTVQVAEQGKYQVGLVENRNATRSEREVPDHLGIVPFPLRDNHVIRKIAVVVKAQMQINGPLGPAERGPFVPAQAQIDHGRVKPVQFLFQTQVPLRFLVNYGGFIKQREKHGRIHFPRAMFVGIGKCRFDRGGYFKMPQLSFTRGKAFGDLAQRIRPAELTEQNRNELVPAGKSLGLLFCVMLAYHVIECHLRKKVQQLSENPYTFSHAGLLHGV